MGELGGGHPPHVPLSFGDVRQRTHGRGGTLLPDEELWAYDTDRRIRGAPAIGSNGVIYFGTTGLGSEGRRLYALNPDGTLKWYHQVGGYVESTPVVGGNGYIYFGDTDDNVYAVKSDGSRAWEHEVAGHVESPLAIADDGTLYVVWEDGRVNAFTATGGGIPPTPSCTAAAIRVTPVRSGAAFALIAAAGLLYRRRRRS